MKTVLHLSCRIIKVLTGFTETARRTLLEMLLNSELFRGYVPAVRVRHVGTVYTVPSRRVPASRTQRPLPALPQRHDDSWRKSHVRGTVSVRLPRDDQVQYVTTM